ncbi:major facilitator superfamily transporter SP family general alpha glucoside:H+ symporter [Fusarium beomiforme]|uniref:Major facilitator superfamily transporter SP family general alpha glucoside:H+ symporter n=1 Tax=Fusarium beomiforme TaxID=44412 RepID=A0A9P5A6C4_9HYPO|nr:major facilitator superfamily transporter SP family general alpha glucoside:H+ symporter [Fusarium beomiforme]
MAYNDHPDEKGDAFSHGLSAAHTEHQNDPHGGRRESTAEQLAAQHLHEVNDCEELRGILTAAEKAAETEHNMTFMEGLRAYPKAMGWSIALSTCIIMEGYDTILIGNLYAMKPFNEYYGHLDSQGGYSISAAWQSGLTNGASVGEILGLYASGWLADRFGYKKVLASALVMMTAFIFIQFFSVSLSMLLVGEILCGLPWGVFQTLTTTYAAEVCPIHLRCYLTTYVNLCWVIGQLIASGVLRGTVSLNSKWSYKIPFAVQWVWPIPILIAVLLAPESPWWFIRKGRVEEAKRSVERLQRKGTTVNADETVAMMIHTDQVERKISEGTGYLDCFRGRVNLRRTEIACLTWICQTICGSSFMGNSTYFYEQAGLADSSAFDMTIAQFALGFIGTVLSWPLMARVGRRKIYVWGLFLLTVILFVTGCLGIPPKAASRSWAIGSLLLVYTFTYDITVGPVCYSLVAELPSSRLRQRTIVLARNAYNIVGVAYTNIIGLYSLNPTAWNWGAKSAFFWAGNCALCFVWAYFRLPEPKDRSYAELDMLFDQGVSARKFATTYVNPYETERRSGQDSDSKGKVMSHVE